MFIKHNQVTLSPYFTFIPKTGVGPKSGVSFYWVLFILWSLPWIMNYSAAKLSNMSSLRDHPISFNRQILKKNRRSRLTDKSLMTMRKSPEKCPEHVLQRISVDTGCCPHQPIQPAGYSQPTPSWGRSCTLTYLHTPCLLRIPYFFF